MSIDFTKNVFTMSFNKLKSKYENTTMEWKEFVQLCLNKHVCRVEYNISCDRYIVYSENNDAMTIRVIQI